MKKIRRKSGFTIAELSIAMMLVATIAMIMLPTLVNSNERQILTTTLNKTYTQLQQLNQTIGLLKTQGRISPVADIVTTYKTAIELTTKTLPAAKANEVFNNYSNPDILPSRAADRIALKNGLFFFFEALGTGEQPALADNEELSQTANPAADADPDAPQNIDNKAHLIVDINGSKSPNEVGRDIFYFTIMEIQDQAPNFGARTSFTRIEPANSPNCDETSMIGCTKKVIEEGKMNY